MAYYKTKTWDSFVTFLLRSPGAKAEMCGLQYYKFNLVKCTDLCSGIVKRSSKSRRLIIVAFERIEETVYHC